ncbi:MAG TPA: hypothetical protein VFK09_09670 [Gemmatimonadales bacterium]|jgi:hypothetical protein|nr:hypothetical protein [Gemmatimonadales bacterium]
MRASQHRFGLYARQNRGAPTACIYLESIVRQANGMLSVTPECGTLAELEQSIAELKSDLDVVLREGRKLFNRDPKVHAG